MSNSQSTRKYELANSVILHGRLATINPFHIHVSMLYRWFQSRDKLLSSNNKYPGHKPFHYLNGVENQLYRSIINERYKSQLITLTDIQQQMRD
jgi:hypothetical protein